MEQDVAWLSVEGGLMGVVSGVFVGVAIVVVVKKGLCHKRLLSKRLLLLSKKVKAGGGQGGSVAAAGSGVWQWCLVVQQWRCASNYFFTFGQNFQKTFELLK